MPKHPLWMSLFAIPLIAAIGMPGDSYFNILQLVALLFLSFKLSVRFATVQGSSLANLLTGVAAVLPHYVWNFSPDIFSSLMLLAGLVALPSSGNSKKIRYLLSGVFLGIAAVSKFSLILAIPGIPLVCGRPLKRSLPFLCLGLMVPLMFQAGLNIHLFGSPLTTSYDRIAKIEGNGVTIHSQRSDFNRPIATGLRDQIMDPAHGLLHTSPITLLAMFGLIPLAHRNRNLALYLLITFVSIFIFFSAYDLWAASHFGNRFLMPVMVMVLATIPLAN